jgi:hypothetical protein
MEKPAASPTWRFDRQTKRLTHCNGLVLVFYSEAEFEIERLPPGTSTRQLRELVREAEQAYAVAMAKPSVLQASPPPPPPTTGLRASRLSLRPKKVTDTT